MLLLTQRLGNVFLSGTPLPGEMYWRTPKLKINSADSKKKAEQCSCSTQKRQYKLQLTVLPVAVLIRREMCRGFYLDLQNVYCDGHVLWDMTLYC
jgi:hypothetical protein